MTMTKIKHNKKRNSAFLFEGLIRILTRSIMEKDAKIKKDVLDILKEHFKKGSELYKDLSLYRSLYEARDIDRYLAEKILLETKRERVNKLNEDKLFEEQSALLKVISKRLGDKKKDLFSSFIPNYKNIATVYQLFNANVSVRSKILLEEKYINDFIVRQKDADQKYEIDRTVFKEFLKKFNNEYGDKLLSEQKELIGKYIESISDLTEFKLYLNEEIGRLKKVVNKSLFVEDVKSDPEMVNKTKAVLEKLEGFGRMQINDELLSEVVKIQQLVHEIEKD